MCAPGAGSTNAGRGLIPQRMFDHDGRHCAAQLGANLAMRGTGPGLVVGAPAQLQRACKRTREAVAVGRHPHGPHARIKQEVGQRGLAGRGHARAVKVIKLVATITAPRLQARHGRRADGTGRALARGRALIARAGAGTVVGGARACRIGVNARSGTARQATAHCGRASSSASTHSGPTSDTGTGATPACTRDAVAGLNSVRPGSDTATT